MGDEKERGEWPACGGPGLEGKVLKIDRPHGAEGCGIAAFGGDEFYSQRYASAFPPSKSFYYVETVVK